MQFDECFVGDLAEWIEPFLLRQTIYRDGYKYIFLFSMRALEIISEGRFGVSVEEEDVPDKLQISYQLAILQTPILGISVSKPIEAVATRVAKNTSNKSEVLTSDIYGSYSR